jgi:hypothetical protein
MKCIKSIRATKNTEVGVFMRIKEIDAENKVKTGNWSYVPKEEYKIWKKGGNVESLEIIEEKVKPVKKKK